MPSNFIGLDVFADILGKVLLNEDIHITQTPWNWYCTVDGCISRDFLGNQISLDLKTKLSKYAISYCNVPHRKNSFCWKRLNYLTWPVLAKLPVTILVT